MTDVTNRLRKLELLSVIRKAQLSSNEPMNRLQRRLYSKILRRQQQARGAAHQEKAKT